MVLKVFCVCIDKNVNLKFRISFQNLNFTIIEENRKNKFS